MNKCKCCETIIEDNHICCKEHIYDYRYLKKFTLTKEEIIEICSVKTKFSIKHKYIIWKNGLIEHPKCKICSKELTSKKILINNNTTSLCCSKECYNEYKSKNYIKIIPIISKDIKRELSKFTDIDINDYANLLLDKYKNISKDLLFINKLFINNLHKLPECYFCGSEHTKVSNNKIYKCCSKECSTSFKNSNKSYKDILQYYKDLKIPEEFLSDINIHELAKIYSNKKKNIHICHCGKYSLNKYCSILCKNKEHLINFDKFNLLGFNTFILENKFDNKLASEYFNCSYSTINRYKKTFGIKERNKYTIEDDVIYELSKFIDYEPITNDRTLIKPKEIDIVYKNFCIEYNGLYWHSNKNLSNENILSHYHLNKTEMIEQNNMKLFHIFENEWLNKRDVWINVIKTYVQSKDLNNSICEFIDTIKANKFLKSYYLDTIDKNCDKYIGVYHNNELIAVGGFIKNRLIYICQKYSYNIEIILQQIIDFYIDCYNLENISIQLNRRWQHYNLNNKFIFINNTEPNKYIFNNKSSLLNYSIANISEFDNSFRIIFDCGYSILKYTPQSV